MKILRSSKELLIQGVIVIVHQKSKTSMREISSDHKCLHFLGCPFYPDSHLKELSLSGFMVSECFEKVGKSVTLVGKMTYRAK